MIDEKNHEWADRVFATEDEIRSYYDRLKHVTTLRVYRAASKDEAEEAIEEAVRHGFSKWPKIGPVALAEAETFSLKDALSLKQGESGVFKYDRGYAAVYVESTSDISLPPIKKMHDRLKREIVQKKRTMALQAWLEQARNSAEIHVYRDRMKTLMNNAVQEGKE
jgi:hypothetical protein